MREYYVKRIDVDHKICSFIVYESSAFAIDCFHKYSDFNLSKVMSHPFYLWLLIDFYNTLL